MFCVFEQIFNNMLEINKYWLEYVSIFCCHTVDNFRASKLMLGDAARSTTHNYRSTLLSCWRSLVRCLHEFALSTVVCLLVDGIFCINDDERERTSVHIIRRKYRSQTLRVCETLCFGPHSIETKEGWWYRHYIHGCTVMHC